MSRFRVASIVLGLISVTSFASVQSSTQEHLSLGCEFDVVGDSFSVPVHTWLRFGRRKVPLRVARGATSTAFHAKLARTPAGLAGDCILEVKTRGTRVPSTLSGLAIELPTPGRDPLGTVTPGSIVTLDGQYFGVRRGRVVVGERRAKVTSWSDQQIVFVVPRGVPAGLAFVIVSNTAGTATEKPVITIGS